MATLRVYAAHHLADHAVFAGSVPTLKNQQQRLGILSRKLRLLLGHPVHHLLEQRFGFVLVVAGQRIRIARVVVGK